ncbi:leader peptidase (prepilin peptidase)/N-methyltransferase [Catenulispora sp. EB89]|uniref:prepilin peptidase n=1 Tax=Catenulispora sp. EB89 TaxID=3156257 RepID=UPI003513314B
MQNRLLSRAVNASPQARRLADALVQAHSAGTQVSELIPTTRAALDQLAKTYVDRGPEPGAADGGRRPVRLPLRGWIVALACINVELLLVILRLVNDDQLPVYSYFSIVGTLLAAIDIAVMRLPNWLTLPSYPAILALLGLNARWYGDGAAMIRAVEAAGVVLGLFLMLCLLTDTGLGDLKFAGLVGLTLGARSWGSVLEGFAIAWGIAAIWGIVQLFRGRLKSRIPLGPYLTAGTMLALLWP